MQPQRTPSARAQRRARLFSLALIGLFLASLILPLLRGHSPLSLGLDLVGGARVVYRPDFSQLPERFRETDRGELLSMAKDTLTGRLLHRFETLPDVVIRSDERIVVSLPGELDQRQILETLGRTHRLTFRLAHSFGERPDSPRGLLLPYRGSWLDLGEELVSGDALDPQTIRVGLGSQHDPARPGPAATVSFEFLPPYDERFAKITAENRGETLAILLDDRVEWAGTIESEIRGPGQLRGAYTAQEASEVAGLLRAGTLPLSLEIESLQTVGPSLGEELRQRGTQALAWSALGLALLLALAYGHRPSLLLAGFLSLALLGVFTLGMIRGLGLTVDLVAIAGLVLSLGMGMDAFILVFEALEKRPRREGAEPEVRSAVREVLRIYSFRGEGRALIHANLTTLAVVVLLLGIDRLKAFALFLIVGQAASLLTLLVTRQLLIALAERGWLEPVRPRGLFALSPAPALRGARPGLFRWKRVYLAALLCGLAAAAATVGFSETAGLRWGPDFQPGLQIQIETRGSERALKAPETGDLAGRLERDFRGIEVRSQRLGSGDSSPSRRLLTLQGSPWGPEGSWGQEDASSSEGLTPERLVRWLGDEGQKVLAMDSIDSRLSGRRTLTSLAVMFFSLSLLGIYLCFLRPSIDRWFASGASAPEGASDSGRRPLLLLRGTMLAVVSDLAAVLAALALLRIPIGMPEIAGLLTIIGYSVNDSMVLACHLEKPSAAPPRDRLAEGIDTLLSRTLLTSLSTMLPAAIILATGLDPLRGFAWTILIGTIAGTLSSTFIVASSLKLEPRESRQASAPTPRPADRAKLSA
ncbi:MAG: hypothetical protein AAF725_09870 [Acidobacteriota bacterium]